MTDVYQQGEIEAVLPLDNASNSLNRKTKLQKTQVYFKLLPETNQMICSLEQKSKIKIER